MKKVIKIFTLVVLIASNLRVSAFEYRIVTNSVDTTFNGYNCVLYNTSEAITSYIGTIKDGKIDINGESKRSFPAFIKIYCDSPDFTKRPILINLIVEPGTITLDWNERYPIAGGNLNQGLNDYITKLNSFVSEPALQKEVWKEVFKGNYNNGLGECALRDAVFHCSPDEWAEAISLLDDETKGMDGISDFTERMEKVKLTWEGQPFTELHGKDLDGKDVSLSDYVGKGKFVVADIWASWCGGCIIEAREMLIPLYNEYKDNENVQFVGIALDDVSEAVKKLGIPWDQIMYCGNAMDAYCAYSIPEVIIFSPDGTILYRRLHGQETATKLKEALKQ